MNRSPLAVAAVIAGLAVTSCGGGSDTATDAPPSEGPVAVADCVKPEVEPRSITVACADDGFVIEDLDWQSWGGSEASATGTARIRLCKPNCVEGPLREYDVDVTLSGFQDCEGAEAYRDLRVGFVDRKPKPYENPYSTRLVCSLEEAH